MTGGVAKAILKISTRTLAETGALAPKVEGLVEERTHIRLSLIEMSVDGLDTQFF